MKSLKRCRSPSFKNSSCASSRKPWSGCMRAFPSTARSWMKWAWRPRASNRSRTSPNCPLRLKTTCATTIPLVCARCRCRRSCGCTPLRERPASRSPAPTRRRTWTSGPSAWRATYGQRACGRTTSPRTPTATACLREGWGSTRGSRASAARWCPPVPG